MANSDSSGTSKQPPTRGQRARQQEALNAFLVAADSYARRGDIIEAEVRFKQALYTAEKEFGKQSDQTMLVLSCLAAFYVQQNRKWDARTIECRIAAWQMEKAAEEEAELGALGKQLKRKPHEPTDPQAEGSASGQLTPALRKACQILGLPPDEPITVASVNRAWKSQMLKTSAHPDLGGDTDEAVILNKAKELLMKYLESLQPNLGKKFKKS